MSAFKCPLRVYCLAASAGPFLRSLAHTFDEMERKTPNHSDMVFITNGAPGSRSFFNPP